MTSTIVSKAAWPFRLPTDLPPDYISKIRRRVEELASAAQYGWGHTIDFGSFTKVGILGDSFLEIAGMLDQWAWWPKVLTAQTVADVGCFTGGLSLYLAARNPRLLYAVDEIPEHVQQCAFLAEVFCQRCIRTVESSLFVLRDQIPDESLDLVLLSGVLYHLSDMLVGLYIPHCLLKPGGVLLIETNAVNDFKHSYANFGRFYAGMWWQPSALCLQDMCDFMGFEDTEIRFYNDNRCLVRTVRASQDIPFKRGLNWRFDSLRDVYPRPMDPGIMAPVDSRRRLGRGVRRAIAKVMNLLRSKHNP